MGTLLIDKPKIKVPESIKSIVRKIIPGKIDAKYQGLDPFEFKVGHVFETYYNWKSEILIL